MPRHFRGAANLNKPQLHANNNGIANDMDEFFTAESSTQRFKEKLRWFAEAIGNNPTIFAWELWDEINSVSAKEESWLSWTKEMLSELHRLFPQNMACYNLGSYGSLSHHHYYQDMIEMAENDFNQAHRYLDSGADFEACHGPFDLLCADAIYALREKSTSKPILLSKIGAVEWCHSTPSHLYKLDKEGMLLHDTLFSSFFAGSAGTGEFWH